MKIAILTFQYANNKNYGASLQSYACRKLVENISRAETVKIIDYNPDPLKLKKKLKISFFASSFKFLQFNKKFLDLTEPCKNNMHLKKLNKKYDIFIVGSDQVWRTKWLQEKVKHYFFDFVDENKKKIAYAASFGVDYWEGASELTEKIKPLIKEFDHISVREESGIVICKNTFGVNNAVCVLDPTLMISREDYQPILDEWQDKNHLNKKYIAHMLLDDTIELKKESQKIANHLEAKISYIKGKEKNFYGKNIFHIIKFHNGLHT